jgi:hypothetical protein
MALYRDATRSVISGAEMTIGSSEDQLAAVKGKIRRINMWNDYDRYHDGLLYYWDNAEKLKDSANIVWKNQRLGNAIASMLADCRLRYCSKG